MTPTPSGRAGAAVCAVLAAWAGLFAYLATIEPTLHDGWWLALDLSHRPLSPGALADFIAHSYTHDNPRLGQWLTYVAFASGPWHALLAAAGAIATLVGAFVLAFGRWPRRPGDAARLVVIAGLAFACLPNPGQMFCYRPFTGNYVWAFAVTLALIAPYRLALAQPTAPRGRWPGVGRAIAMLVAGVAAGLCNEHTGPAAIAAVAAACELLRRRERRVPAWALAGLVGVIAGTALLLTAPGQELRYHGLAAQSSLLGSLVERGVGGNLAVLGKALLYTCGSWLVIAGALVARRRRPGAWRVDVAVLAVAALAIVATVLVSPKLGARLFYAPALLLLAAAARALDEAVGGCRIARGIATGVAAALALGGAAIVVVVQRDARADADARAELLAAAAPGTIAAVPPFRHFAPTWWTFGDDFRAAPLREHVARRVYHLDDATLATRAPSILAQSGVTLVLELDPADPAAARAADPDGEGFSDQVFSPEGLEGARARFHAAIAALGAAGRAPARARLRLVGLDAPALGARPLVLASWDAGGGFRDPTVDVDAHGDLVLRAGDDARPTGGRTFGELLASAPPGGYLLLACDPEVCHVVAARHK